MDQERIYDHIDADDKKRLEIPENHLNLPDSKTNKRLIKKIVNDQNLTLSEKLFYLKESSP